MSAFSSAVDPAPNRRGKRYDGGTSQAAGILFHPAFRLRRFEVPTSQLDPPCGRTAREWNRSHTGHGA